MRAIKFRGRRLDGPFVFGDFCHYPHGVVKIRISEGGFYHVDPDTVAQLVGYDANGKEVYEGDTLIVGKNGAEYVVDYRDPPDYISWHSLKETSHD